MKKEKLTRQQFREKLIEKYGDIEIYTKTWNNYPNSTFYYDTPNFDGLTENIGIYTNETTYGIGSC